MLLGVINQRVGWLLRLRFRSKTALIMKKILVLHGPNLNILGTRETSIYGKKSLDDINRELSELTLTNPVQLLFFQSNHEGVLIDKVHEHIANLDGLIINPAAFTHTSVALRDAVSCLSCPKVEVHLSNIHRREEFRRHSYFSDIVDCVICGAGVESYKLGLRYLESVI